MTRETPFGPVWASVDARGAIRAFGFGSSDCAGGESPELARQLAEYFRAERTVFDLPLAPDGTDFQKQVWAELCRIPHGKTISYMELAVRVGRLGAARAVGRANATNPIALIVPCHRVIGADGTLTGYAYGVDFKRRLLDFERGGFLP